MVSSTSASGTGFLTPASLSVPGSSTLSPSTTGSLSADSSRIALSSTVPSPILSSETLIPSRTPLPEPPAAPVSAPSTALVSSPAAAPPSSVQLPSSSPLLTTSLAPSSSPAATSLTSLSDILPSQVHSTAVPSSTIVPVVPLPSSTDSLPDQAVSTVSEHRAAVTQSTAHSPADTKASSPSTTAKMAGSEASTESSPSTSAPAQTSEPATSEVTSATETKTGASRPDPEPITGSGTESSSPSTSASHSTSVSSVISTSPTSVTSQPATSPQASPTSQARPTETKTEASSNSASPTSQAQGVSSTSLSLITSSSHEHTRSPAIPIPVPPSITTSAPVPHSSTAAVSTTPPDTVISTFVPTTRAVIFRPPAPTTIESSSLERLLTAPVVQTHAVSPVTAAEPAPSTTPAPPVPSVPSPSENGSEGSSGIKQAVAAGQNAESTRTSTVTDQPETTLSTPVFFTVTDGKSHTSLSEPPVFTSIGVSTKPDGQLVSVTHVIANPTGIWDVSSASAKSGFFGNTKAVAAVFLVVGILITGVTLGICFVLRRRRHRSPRFLPTISRPLPMPDNPFEDPRDLSPPPQMRYASGFTDRTLVIAGAEANRPARSPFDDSVDHAPARDSGSHNSQERLTGLGLAGVGAHGRRPSGDVRSSTDPRPRNPSGTSSVGLAFTSDQCIDAARRPAEPSSGRSTPSLYPPTIPALHGEDNQSLVDIPLSTNNSTTQVGPLPSPTSNRSSLRVSSPTTRKPVPVHADLPEQPQMPASSVPIPVAPAPRTPQQAQQAATKPPVVPPRSPLRRSTSRSPPPVLASIQTQLQKPEEDVRRRPYEPPTPPASFSSISPAGSQSGHESSSPSSSVGTRAGANPFTDAHAGAQDSFLAGPPKGSKRDTFYTRMSGLQQRRPSVEWKN